MKRIALVMLAVTLAAAGPSAQDLERLFKAAVNTETVDRNCKGAIEQYKKVAAGSNRALAAQALLRMAGCQQRLGDAEAPRIYERIVSDYADQGEIVSQARARLSAIAPSRSRADRLVIAGPQTWGRVSPDGRLISFIDYGAVPPELKVQNLVEGASRPIAGCGSASAFSPDGTQLVCGGGAISIVNVEGPPRLRQIYKNADVEFFFPSDWSADGNFVAVTTRRKDRTRQLAVAGIADGSFRVLKTVGWRGPGGVFFSPDGKHLAYDLPAGDDETQRDVFLVAVDGSGETVAVGDTSNDVVIGWTPDGSVLFASDRNGPIGLWSLPVSAGKPAGVPPVLLKADIGSMESLGLTRSGALYVVKPASTVSVQVVPIDLAQGRLTGPPVAQIYGADTPAWSPDSTRLAYMHRPPNGIPVLAIRSLESGRVQELKPRLLYMPMPTWLPDGKSIVTWGRDLNGKGVIVRLDVETGQQTHVTDAYDIQQVQVSPDGRKIYHSDDNFRGPAATNRGFFERDLETGAVRRIDFGGGLSPDGKLVARISVDEKSRTSTIVFVPPNGGEARRVNVPTRVEGFRGSSWMPDSQGLLVAETGDDTKPRSLWLVPISGAAPRRLDIDVSNWILPYGVRLSPDGTRIAFFTGQEASEVWAIENVTAVRGKR